MEVFRYARCALVNMSITLIQRSAPWGSGEGEKEWEREWEREKRNDKVQWQKATASRGHGGALENKSYTHGREKKYYVHTCEVVRSRLVEHFDLKLLRTHLTNRKRKKMKKVSKETKTVKHIGKCEWCCETLQPQKNITTANKTIQTQLFSTHTFSHQMCRHGLGNRPGHSAFVVALQVKVHQPRFAGENEHARFDWQTLALGHKGVHHRNFRLRFLRSNRKM